jgi:predicted nucleotidyltransferase
VEELREFGMSERILEDLRRVSRRFPEIERVLIYGSRARGDFKPYSDIDLAVVAPTLTPQRFTELWSALEGFPRGAWEPSKFVGNPKKTSMQTPPRWQLRSSQHWKPTTSPIRK